MKRTRFFSILVLTTMQFQCIHYFAKDSSEFNLTEEETKILQSKKIGLVGFRRVISDTNRFRNPISLNDNGLRLIRFLDNSKKNQNYDSINSEHFDLVSKQGTIYKKKLSEKSTNETYFPFGTKSFPSTRQTDKRLISDDKLRFFLKTYFEKVNHLGIEELLQILDFSNPKKIKLKSNDFDYWIIGLHSPDLDPQINLAGVLSAMTAVFTRGLFPIFAVKDISSDYLIFDSKLNLIQSIAIPDKISFVVSVWYLGNADSNDGHPPGEVYESNVKQFTKELVKVIRKN